MITYLTSVTLIWSVGLLLYALLLRPLASHGFNRAYLLLVLVLGVGMAAMPFGWFSDPTGVHALRESTTVWLSTLTVSAAGAEPAAAQDGTVAWGTWLYGLGLGISLIITAVGGYRLVRCFGESRPGGLVDGMLIRELPDIDGPFSVGRHLFVREWHAYAPADARALVAHEAAHFRLLHTVDRVIVTVVRHAFWFHPLVYILDHELRLVHEYHADAKALASAELASYRRLLLAHQFRTRQPFLAAAFAQSPLQNRFTMMTKTFHSNQSWRVALATVALLLAAMACTKDSVDDQDLAELESAQSEGLSADDALAGYFQGAEKGEYVLSVDTLEIFDPETFESRFELVYNFSSANGTNHRSFTRSMSTAPGMTAGTSELVRNQEVFKIAEVMPHFPDPNCTSDDRACYEKALLENLYGNIRYPQADKDAGVEGKVLVQFVVGTDGELLEPRIIRSPSEAMSAEVLRVLGEMPAWVPGRQRGQDVQVSFVLPVQFKLE